MPSHPITHRQPNSWLKIRIETPKELTDIVAAFLGNLTGTGVEYESNSAPDKNLIPETVTGYLPDDGQAHINEHKLHSFLAKLQKTHPGAAQIKVQTALIEEEDWGAAWKKHFKPAKITSRLVVKPSWERYVPNKGETVIEIDPGMAFGTGLHASTRLALELIERLICEKKPKNALDIGAGTGILGIACALLGVKEVLAIDNDPDAVAAAQTNADQNDLCATIRISPEGLLEVQGRFDLIIANITHDILAELALPIKDRLTDNGQVILSGILKGEQAESIKKMYSNLGLTVVTSRDKDEWTAIGFAKKASS